MFIRALIPIAALAAVVAAAPSALRARQSECSTGPIKCCNSTKTATADDANYIMGLLGVVLNVGELIGTGCSPIVGDSGCNAQPVCCNNNDFNGLINIGCSPITIL